MMKEKIKRGIIAGIALIGIGLVGKYVYGYVYSGYKWDSNPTYYFYKRFDWWIGRGVGKELKGAWKHAKKGADTWNDVSDCDFELKYGGKKWNWGGFRDNVNTVDAWEQTAGSGGGVGQRDSTVITWVWTSGSKILEVDTNFNYKLKWSAADTCPSDKYDVQNTATHEFGHWLMLNDLYSSSDSDKTMYGYTWEGATFKRSLHQDDIDGIKYIYSKSSGGGGGGGGCMNAEVDLNLSEKEVAILESFREKLAISQSPEGSIGNSYYQFEQKIWAVLRMNPKLREQTRNLIKHFMPDIEDVINEKKGRILDKTDLELFRGWLTEVSKYGAPDLQEAIGQVKGMIKEGKEMGLTEMVLSPDISELPDAQNPDSEIEKPEKDTPINLQTRLLSSYPDSDKGGYYIPFELAETVEVNIEIYNIVGQKVKGLNLGTLGPGRYKEYWNATNTQGEKVSKGLYFCKFQAGKVIQTGIILISK